MVHVNMLFFFASSTRKRSSYSGCHGGGETFPAMPLLHPLSIFILNLLYLHLKFWTHSQPKLTPTLSRWMHYNAGGAEVFWIAEDQSATSAGCRQSGWLDRCLAAQREFSMGQSLLSLLEKATRIKFAAKQRVWTQSYDQKTENRVVDYKIWWTRSGEGKKRFTTSTKVMGFSIRSRWVLHQWSFSTPQVLPPSATAPIGNATLNISECSADPG